MKFYSSVLALGVILITSSAVFAQSPALTLADGVDSHKGVDRIYSDFSKSYETLDYELLAGLYTEDATYLSPNKDIQSGRAEIEGNFESFFGRMEAAGRSMSIAFNIVKRHVDGGIGYDVGTFKIQYSEKGKPTNIGTGKFVVVTVLGEDGKWRFAVDGYSALAPPENQ